MASVAMPSAVDARTSGLLSVNIAEILHHLSEGETRFSAATGRFSGVAGLGGLGGVCGDTAAGVLGDTLALVLEHSF